MRRGMTKQLSAIDLANVTGGAQWVQCKDGSYSKIPNSDVPPGAQDLVSRSRKGGFRGVCSHHGGIKAPTPAIDPYPGNW